MKRFLPLLVVGFFVLNGLGAAATSLYGVGTDLQWKQTGTSTISRDDELDQYQPDWDFFAPVGVFPFEPDINYMVAQSFKPTKQTLTRVEILAAKNSTTIYDYTLAIREDLLGPDLTSISLSPDNFIIDNFSWVEFDFDDIIVTPGNTYYIVSSTIEAPENFYGWAVKLSNVYPNGTAWHSEDDGATWEEDTTVDLTLATYGTDNLPPEDPLLDGPLSGDVGTEYDYTVTANDPDGDDLYYIVDWGDGTPETTIGPYPNGQTGTASHTWTSKGTYTVKAKARDVYGAESDWVELTVSMPRNKLLPNTFLMRLLERFPNAFPAIRHILGL